MKSFLSHSISTAFLLGCLVVLGISCSLKSDTFSQDVFEYSVDSVDVSSIWDKVEPLSGRYSFQLIDRGGYYFIYIDGWGDLYKLDKVGELLWELNFNEKKIISTNPLSLDQKGATLGMDYFDTNFYFLQSKLGMFLSEYSEDGELQHTYSDLVLEGNIEQFKILDEETMLLATIKQDRENKVFRVLKYDFISHKRQELFKIEVQSSFRESYRVKFIEDRVLLLGSYQRVGGVYAMDGTKVDSIEIQLNSKRRFDNEELPKDVDFFSLSNTEKLYYLNDQTVDFSKYGNDLFALHYIMVREDTVNRHGELMLTHETKDESVREYELEDELFLFDDFGNLIYTKKWGERTFMYKVTRDKIDTHLDQMFE